MKRILLCLSGFMLASTTLITNAQTPNSRNCATMSHLELQKTKDPGLVARMQAIEDQTNAFVASHRNNNVAVPIVTIPVVFHVVYKTAAQNISDAQCIAQLNQLNLDYAKLNTDFNTVPAVFQTIAADSKVQFCLAQQDPTGNPTTGIIHKSTTSTSFIDDDKVKSNSTGGDNAWDRNKYLNIWVCNLGNQLLGYAQFPGGAAATDGVVLLYSSVGSMTQPGTATPYHLGRTATHEVGHWLNLRHIWGDANCGNDLVNDTPTQQTSNFSCPTFPQVTCSNGPNGDMFMNYMDYVDDNCMKMFTNGQGLRMQALFGTGGSRASLLTSTGCQSATSGSFSFNSIAATSITCGTNFASANIVSAVTGTFTTPIVLSASGNPAGTTVTFGAPQINPGGSTTVNIGNTSSLAPGSYNITITGTAGTLTQNTTMSFVVTPGTAPTITSQPADVSVCTGGAVNFSTNSSTTGVSYQWQDSTSAHNWQDITGATGASYSIASSTDAMSGNKYRAIIKTACGISTTDAAHLTVSALSVNLSANPSNTALLPGNSVTLTATVNPNIGFDFNWYRDGVLIDGLHSSSIVVNADHVGDYEVEASSTNCSRRSDVVNIRDSVVTRLFVYPNPSNGIFDVSYYQFNRNINQKNIQSIIVYNSQGAKVFEKDWKVDVSAYSKLSINLSKLESGIYNLILLDGYGEKIASSQILIQH